MKDYFNRILVLWNDERGRALIKLGIYLIFMFFVVMYARGVYDKGNHNSITTSKTALETYIEKDRYKADVSVEGINSILRFNDSLSSEIRIWFNNILRRFTPEERCALLKFTTGRIRLPPKDSDNQFQFIVDNGSGIDVLPTASTCFNQLHMPRYTSEEKMYILIRAAVCFTGSIENT